MFLIFYLVVSLEKIHIQCVIYSICWPPRPLRSLLCICFILELVKISSGGSSLSGAAVVIQMNLVNKCSKHMFPACTQSCMQ